MQSLKKKRLCRHFPKTTTTDIEVSNEVVAGKGVGKIVLIQVVPNQREENVVALSLLVG